MRCVRCESEVCGVRCEVCGHSISLSWILYTSAASNPTVTADMLNIAWRRHSWRAMYSTSVMKFVFLFLRSMRGFIFLTQHVP